MKNWVKSFPIKTTKAWLLTVTILVVGLHYIFFVDSINQDRKCRGEYNALVVKSQVETQQLSKDAFDNQNLLTKNFAAVDNLPVADQPAAREKVFAEHEDRLKALEARYAANKLPELPSCFK